MSYILELVNVLETEDKDTRIRIIHALRELEDKSAIEPFIKTLEDDDIEIRRIAMYALSCIADNSVVDVFISQLRRREIKSTSSST